MGIFDDFQQNLKKNFDGLKSEVVDQSNSILSSKSTVKSSSLPWDKVGSRFFNAINIDTQKWDQLFPYRLIVVDVLKGNSIVFGGEEKTNSVVIKETRTTTVTSDVDHYYGNQWVFTLPITPEQLNISDLFAINTSATLNGVLEEHGGVKFKMINAQGTMGVWPARESVTAPPANPSVFQSVFAGTLEAASNFGNQIARTINTVTSGTAAPKPVSKRPELSTAGPGSTSFYLAQKMQQFLEQYAEAKKDPANKGWRLVLDIPKQSQSFVVTPIQFAWQQNASKPLHVNYNLQLKAWRRIILNEKTEAIKPDIQTIDPGILQRTLNTISEARRTLSSVTDLIGAVRSDVTRPLDVLRQTSLFVKDLVGAVVTTADLPFRLQRDYKHAVNDFFKSMGTNAILASAATDPDVAQGLKDLKINWRNNEGVNSLSVAQGEQGIKAAQAQSIDPAMAMFESPEKNHLLMDQVPANALVLSQAQQDAIENSIDEARQISVDDLRVFRTVIQDLALQFSNNFGSGAAFYSQVYNKPTPNDRIQPITLDEYQLLKVLYDVMQVYDILTASTELDDAKKQTNMEYVAGLADLAGIQFSESQSKILVPVPAKLTIEGIAMRYLSDPQRWLEIATLNNLKSPYIDEDGFQYDLLSNASGRQITVSSSENLYVGQRIVLHSSTQPMSARRILNIEKLSATSYLITLDGVADLDNFVTSDSAYLQAYLPGTVNSQQKIFMPSNLVSDQGANIIIPSSVQNDTLVGLSKVDLLLNDNGDIATNSFGDFRLAAGMTNIVQALKIKFGTQKGRVLLHPEFGLGLKAGSMSSEITVQEIFKDINTLIKADIRFDGLETLQVQLNGPTLTINIGVRLAGNNGVFPIAFDIPA